MYKTALAHLCSLVDEVSYIVENAIVLIQQNIAICVKPGKREVADAVALEVVGDLGGRAVYYMSYVVDDYGVDVLR